MTLMLVCLPEHFNKTQRNINKDGNKRPQNDDNIVFFFVRNVVSKECFNIVVIVLYI